MNKAVFEALGDDIYCIDALYMAPDIACCYLVVSGYECALIETGTANSVENILATLKALSIDEAQLRYVIPTHVHLDHAGGAGALLQHFPDVELLIHPKGAAHMIDPTRLIASSQKVYGDELFAKLYGDVLPLDANRVRVLDDGETILLGKRRLRVQHTRGHADHHFCLFDEQSRGWFSGDMFGVSYARQRYAQGSYVMPATTPTQFDPALYQDSVTALCEVKPRLFYLTHYGALVFEEAQRERLLRQLDRYALLGREFTGDLKSLEASVLDATRAELAKLIPESQAEAEAAALGVDATLNAQGIAWWGNKLSLRRTA
ncbi:MAG: glyoxylase-like metal-dependent hydrolase (beta-lactamase superfamily II) [Glaciecola sp.]|jgi:glyoxylase-like metal-dependent hydrolase (beta-lactamase superfamily II)|uniref:MBL fold metallo-hydrolase n=1 Tax=Congregibacter sp. TaxID=2744308 RepID=UPI0039E51F87